MRRRRAIERFDNERKRLDDPMRDELAAMTALCGVPLELLAADDATDRLASLHEEACKVLRSRLDSIPG